MEKQESLKRLLAETAPVFRFDTPSEEDISNFHRDGFIAYPDVFTDEARAGLTDEILNLDPVRIFLDRLRKDPASLDAPHYFVRPWNERGYWSDRLIDAPLVTALLRRTIGSEYHFCHSALKLTGRGSAPVGPHQDHHHWRHEKPVNLAERDKYYIQILYYPNGFNEGDNHLFVIPGSHRVAPLKEATPDRLLSGAYDEEAGCELQEKHLEMPPGSMVYINARMFHGVGAKPPDSLQEYRIFNIDIFKEAGPPHRYTQEIPSEWLASATPGRIKMFARDPYTPDCWTS